SGTPRPASRAQAGPSAPWRRVARGRRPPVAPRRPLRGTLPPDPSLHRSRCTMRTTRSGLPALALVLGLACALPGCNTVSVISLEEQAARAASREQYDVAATKYQQALDQSPGRVHSRVGLGRTQLRMNQPR